MRQRLSLIYLGMFVTGVIAAAGVLIAWR